MTDRPIAGILTAVAAVMFVAAFSAAAVMRPGGAPVTERAATAPASTTEDAGSKVAAPTLSRVAALPALRRPAHRKPAKRKARSTRPRAAAPPPVSAPRKPAATAAPRARTPVYTPPRRTAPPPRRQSPVGRTFDSSG